MEHEIYCIARGRVQLVMYRDFCARRARAVEVRGYVKNLADGSVEVVAQGTNGALEEFIVYVRKGSLLSRVDSVAVEWRNHGKIFDSFTIHY